MVVADQDQKTNSDAKSSSPFYSLLQLLIAGVPIFGGFLYYVGRRYADSYYEAIGIPPAACGLRFEDYVYRGVTSLMFLVALVCTLGTLKLWDLYQKRKRQARPPEFGWRDLWQIVRGTLFGKTGEPSYWMLWYFFFMVCVMVAVSVSLLMSGVSNYPSMAFFGIFQALLFLCFAYPLMTDTATMEFVAKWGSVYRLFFVAVVIVIFMVVHLFPAGCGTFKGMMDSSPQHAQSRFPTIQLTASQPVGPSDLDWERQEDGSWVTTNSVLLLLDTESDLFLRTTTEKADTFSIPKTDITGTRIHFSGRWATEEDNISL